MFRHQTAVSLLALCLAVLAVGCSEPPQQEIDAARAAMTEADQAAAQTYAPEAYDTAQQAMQAADAEIEAQKKKFALTRSYDKAKQLAADAQTAAAQAKEAAATARDEARNAAQSALDAAKAGLDQAQIALGELGNCRRKPKGFQADMEAMQGQLDGLRAQVGGIETALSQEDYAGARTQAEALQGQVDTLNADLSSAKSKIGC